MAQSGGDPFRSGDSRLVGCGDVLVGSGGVALIGEVDALVAQRLRKLLGGRNGHDGVHRALVEAHRDEIALLISLEMGKPIRTAYEIELRALIRCLRFYGELADNLMAGRSGVSRVTRFDPTDQPCQVAACLGEVPCPEGWDAADFARLGEAVPEAVREDFLGGTWLRFLQRALPE